MTSLLSTNERQRWSCIRVKWWIKNRHSQRWMEEKLSTALLLLFADAQEIKEETASPSPSSSSSSFSSAPPFSSSSRKHCILGEKCVRKSLHIDHMSRHGNVSLLFTSLSIDCASSSSSSSCFFCFSFLLSLSLPSATSNWPFLFLFLRVTGLVRCSTATWRS